MQWIVGAIKISETSTRRTSLLEEQHQVQGPKVQKLFRSQVIEDSVEYTINKKASSAFQKTQKRKDTPQNNTLVTLQVKLCLYENLILCLEVRISIVY